MLKAELRKTIKDGLIFVLLAVLVIVLVISGIQYYDNAKYVNNNTDTPSYSAYVLKYDSFEQLAEYRDRNLNSIAESQAILDANPNLEQYELDYLNNQIKYEKFRVDYCNFLLENKIEYGSAIDYNYAGELQDFSASFIGSQVSGLKIYFTIAAAIFACLIVVQDFQKGTYRFVYTRKKTRLLIIFTKYLTHVIVTTVACVALFALNIFASQLFKRPDLNIIMYNASGFCLLNFGQYVGMQFLGVLSYALMFSSLVFFFSMFLKNSALSVICTFALYLGLTLLTVSGSKLLVQIANGISTAFASWNTTIFEAATAFAIYLGAIIALATLSCISFKKRDLLN